MKKGGIMMKKKVLSAMLSAAMVVTLTACGLQAPAETPQAPADNAVAEAPAADDAQAPAETEGDGAAADTSAVEPEVTLVYAEVNPLDTIVGQTGTAFAEKVAELSGGTMKIDVQASGVLGAENDVLDTMLGGGGTIFAEIPRLLYGPQIKIHVIHNIPPHYDSV